MTSSCGLGSNVLEKALKALEHPLCDRCLGRLFARNGFGLENHQRGASVRTVLAMALECGESVGSVDPAVLSRIPVHEEHRKAPLEQRPSIPDIVEEGWNAPAGENLPVPWGSSDEEVHDRCWLCEGIFETLPEMRDLVIASGEEYEFSNFQIGTTVEASMVYREQTLWEKIEPASAEPLKEEYNRLLGKELFEIWTDKGFERSDPEMTFVVDPTFKKVKRQVKPLFIRGRYNKLVRGIPQTRWLCTRCRGRGCESCSGKGKRYETSVEEIIGAHVLKSAMGEDHSLHGMGREDIDVRTLGSGRPFVIEITAPRIRTFDLERLEESINSLEGDRVRVSGLEWSDRKEVRRIKESRALKTYEAIIRLEGDWTEEKLKYGISLLGESPIIQRTPDRVSHRRADLLRERLVHEISAEVLPDGGVRVRIKADAGLYIKELLHGDGGRTIPSLSGTLGAKVTVETLDVLEIEDSYPTGG